MTLVLIRDGGMADALIQERKRKGLDRYDEVWEGTYVMPSVPNNAHQEFLDDLGDVLTEVVKRTGLGKKYQGARPPPSRFSFAEQGIV